MKIRSMMGVVMAGGIVALALAATLGGCATASSPTTGAAPGSPSGKPSLTSNLQIDAGKTFVYAGEADSGGYTASVRNVGQVAVTLGRRIGTTDTALRVLKPGEATLAEFAKGQGALFQNATGQQARLLVLIWGDTNVGMKYEPQKNLSK